MVTLTDFGTLTIQGYSHASLSPLYFSSMKSLKLVAAVTVSSNVLPFVAHSGEKKKSDQKLYNIQLVN